MPQQRYIDLLFLFATWRVDALRGLSALLRGVQELQALSEARVSEQGGVRSTAQMNTRVCKICGAFEFDHHEPDYLEIPAGCVCDWKTWDYYDKSSLPPACEKYEGDGEQNCEKCEHDKACHGHES